MQVLMMPKELLDNGCQYQKGGECECMYTGF